MLKEVLVKPLLLSLQTIVKNHQQIQQEGYLGKQNHLMVNQQEDYLEQVLKKTLLLKLLQLLEGQRNQMLHLLVNFLVKVEEILLKQGAVVYLVKVVNQQQLHYLTQLQTKLNLKKPKLVVNPKNSQNNQMSHLKQVYLGLRLIKINHFNLNLNHNQNLPVLTSNQANQLITE